VTVDFNFPFSISADTPAVAAEVQTNFNDLLTWIKVNYRQKDDTPNLTVQPVLPGSPTIASHATNKAYVDAIVPTGTIMQYAGAAAPSGYLLCDGASYSTTGVNAALFGVIGYAYGGSAGTFNVPNMGGRVTVGKAASGPLGTLGATGGRADAANVEHLHAAGSHTHTINHGHTASSGNESSTHKHVFGHGHTNTGTDQQGDHAHVFATRDNPTASGNVGEPMISNSTGTGSLRATATTGVHGHNVTIPTGRVSSPTGGGSAAAPLSDGQTLTHEHAITVVDFNGPSGGGTGNTANSGTLTGAAITNGNFPPFVVVNYIIKT
jgi:microcystin-dependent protein